MFQESTQSDDFLSAMYLRRTSKDLNSPFLPSIETKSPQNLDKNINSFLISTKKFLPKNSFKKSSQKISPKKISPKKFLEKIPPKKFS